jgi:hypothetical protein
MPLTQEFATTLSPAPDEISAASNAIFLRSIEILTFHLFQSDQFLRTKSGTPLPMMSSLRQIISPLIYRINLYYN